MADADRSDRIEQTHLSSIKLVDVKDQSAISSGQRQGAAHKDPMRLGGLVACLPVHKNLENIYDDASSWRTPTPTVL